jgi:hypothetical protein
MGCYVKAFNDRYGMGQGVTTQGSMLWSEWMDEGASVIYSCFVDIELQTHNRIGHHLQLPSYCGM